MRAWWPAAGLSLLAFVGLTFTRADADLWGHLRFGLDILRDWRLPVADPYSFTQDVPWVNHEWLSELVMGAAVAAFGYAGIPLLKGLLAGAAALVLWRSLGGVQAGVRTAIAVVAFAGTIHQTSSLRPQLWTFLLLAIECRLLASGERRHLLWLPALFVVWVNAHGGWIVGLGVLGAWGGVKFFLAPDTRRDWVAVAAAVLAATLVNPYGWGLWQFVAGTVRMERSIDEWQPLATLPWTHWVPWLLAAAATIWAGRRQLPHRWSVLAVLAMLAYAAARVQRIESLFVTAAVVLLAPAFRAAWPRPIVHLTYPRPRFEGVVAALAFVALAAASIAGASRTLGCVPILSPWSPDLEARQFLDGAQPGRLVTHFNWGEYAIWHFGPRLRVSMDGRRETVYSEGRLLDHDAVVLGDEQGLDLLRSWRPEYVWLPRASQATRTWLASNGYRIDFEGLRSFIAVRAELPPLERRGADPIRPCFPG